MHVGAFQVMQHSSHWQCACSVHHHLIPILPARPEAAPAPCQPLPPCCLQTAATLHDQTNQLNKIVDDLNEIEFTMKKASKVITDIGRGLVTDK